MEPEFKRKIKEVGLQNFPNEAVGFVIYDETKKREEVFVCENVAKDKRNKFKISEEQYIEAYKKGKILAFFHTHCGELEPFDNLVKFSREDIRSSEESCIPFLLLALPTEEWNFYIPTFYEYQNYEGRPYIFGFFDCVTIIMDFYAKEFGIRMEYPRMRKDPIGFYDYLLSQVLKKNLKESKREDIKFGDIICFKKKSGKVNHFGIFYGSNKFLHQPINGDSCIEEFDENFANAIFTILTRP